MNDEQLDKILKKALTPQREIKEEVLQVPWRLHWHLPALFHRHLLRSS